eukprot:TRINITY_DN11725_c0_g3_i1.p1 TRINITY_DN11725_c0_g3~~TRINITY_DN11725_c0_g3_i1.p1  ORF type:complete len:232 (-),score=47.83 TRINITY_DN11725_c0_g3_i1:32-727(-)
MDDCFCDFSYEDADVDESNWKRQMYKETTLAVHDGGSYHFLVTQQKGVNYMQYCNRLRSPANPIKYLKLYSEHTTELFLQVNLSLASDSTSLQEHGEYIQKLRGAVLRQPLLDEGLLYRGVNLSKIETDEMEKLGRFFIPSFTSTSIDMSKIYDKNAILIIKTPYLTKFACSMTEECSEYFHHEREVLVACYSAYQLEKIEKVNGKNYITLFLDEQGSSADRLTPSSFVNL